MSDGKDLSTLVAVTQERVGSLNDKISSLHSRQSKMEENIEKLMKEILGEIQTLSEKMNSEVAMINAYINVEKGKSVVNAWLLRSAMALLFTTLGVIIKSYLETKT